MPGNREGKFTNLAQGIDKYLRGRGFLTASRESLIPIVWAEVVGAWYRDHTEVTRVERGVVTVSCDSSARAQQLQLDSAQIIATLNARVGGRAVREIRASSAGIRSPRARAGGQGPNADPGPARHELERLHLGPEERTWIANTASQVPEDSLRRRFESLLVKQRRLELWKRSHGFVPCAACGALVRPGGRLCTSCDPGRVPQQGSSDVLAPRWDY